MNRRNEVWLVSLTLHGLEIVEHLGSGVPRIVNAYGKNAFEIRDSFIRIIFRFAEATSSMDDKSSGVESGMALRSLLCSRRSHYPCVAE